MSCHGHHRRRHHHQCCCCCCDDNGGNCGDLCSSAQSPTIGVGGGGGPLVEQLLQTLSGQLHHRAAAAAAAASPDQVLQTLAYQILLHPGSFSIPKPQINHPPPPKDRNPRRRETEDPVLHSLRRRVSALESQLPHQIPISPSSAPPPPPETITTTTTRGRASLRDHAARVIQIRFRLFLVRRSRSLRDLKCLAAIRSRAADLRSSLSGKDRPPAGDLSKMAMDLLLQLDSIQSRDLMIREGKRSIGRELSRILDFLEKTVGAAGDDGNYRRAAAAAAARFVPSKSTTKRVSFASAEAGGDLRPFIYDPPSGAVVNENVRRSGDEDDGDDDDPEDEEEEDSSLEAEDRVVGGGDDERRRHGGNGEMGLSAPIPVHMEEWRRS